VCSADKKATQAKSTRHGGRGEAPQKDWRGEMNDASKTNKIIQKKTKTKKNTSNLKNEKGKGVRKKDGSSFPLTGEKHGVDFGKTDKEGGGGGWDQNHGIKPDEKRKGQGRGGSKRIVGHKRR